MAAGDLARIFIHHGMRLTARYLLRTTQLSVHGLEHIPKRGAAVIAMRHFHHLYDGAAAVASIARPLRLFVALDWTPNIRTRRTMEALCRTAGWPIGLRETPDAPREGGFRRDERWSYMKRAVMRSAAVLGAGELLGMFPEGAPVVDPHAPARSDGVSVLHPGICAIIERAQRDFGIAVPIIPIGFRYESDAAGRYTISMSAGARLFHRDRSMRGRTLDELHARIIHLS